MLPSGRTYRWLRFTGIYIYNVYYIFSTTLSSKKQKVEASNEQRWACFERDRFCFHTCSYTTHSGYSYSTAGICPMVPIVNSLGIYTIFFPPGKLSYGDIPVRMFVCIFTALSELRNVLDGNRLFLWVHNVYLFRMQFDLCAVWIRLLTFDVLIFVIVFYFRYFHTAKIAFVLFVCLSYWSQTVLYHPLEHASVLTAVCDFFTTTNISFNCQVNIVLFISSFTVVNYRCFVGFDFMRAICIAAQVQYEAHLVGVFLYCKYSF